MENHDLQKAYEDFSTNFFYEKYSKKMYSWHYFIMKNLHQFFSEGGISAKTCLEIGAGPTIYMVASASKYCDRIVSSDFSESNTRQVKLWVENDLNAFEWTEYLQYCAKLEGLADLEIGATEIKERLQRKIQDIRRCDVTKIYPLQESTELFDVVVSSYCLESATLTESDYIRAVQNISNLLVPGGRLVMSGSIGSSWYIVEQKIPSMPLSEQIVKKALRTARLSVESYIEIDITEFVDVLYDGRHCFFCVARKPVK